MQCMLCSVVYEFLKDSSKPCKVCLRNIELEKASNLIQEDPERGLGNVTAASEDSTPDLIDSIIKYAANLTATEVSGQRLGKGHAITIPRAPTATSKLNANLTAAHKLKARAAARSSKVVSSVATTKARAVANKAEIAARCSVYLKGAVYPFSTGTIIEVSLTCCPTLLCVFP